MATVVSRDRMEVRSDRDVVLVRQHVRRVLQSSGFSLVDQTKMVTAASELARNTVIHGKGGTLDWELLEHEGRRGLRLRFSDDGPGIPNVDQAMADGWSSGNGLGLGLPGARRLVNEFELVSAPGNGTHVTVTRWT